MTKMQSVRVVVPCDDNVTVADLQSRLWEILSPLPVSRVDGADPADGPACGRIHWSAADVLRGAAEREIAPKRAGPRKAAPP